MTLTALKEAALNAHAAGILVGPPPRLDGTKAPSGPWAYRREEGTSVEEIEEWYAEGSRHTGLLIACTDGLEFLDFDTTEIFGRFVVRARASNLCDLVNRIEKGYCEATPNGVHYLYRCTGPTKSLKLARRPKTPEEMTNPGDRYKVLIETKGEGGYAVVAPSFGRVHKSGKPYQKLIGEFSTLALVTPEERQSVHALARSFDELPRRAPTTTGRTRTRSNPLGLARPGDDYTARTTWEEVLEPHGWVAVFERDGVTYWRRPGKDIGISASTNYMNSDLLYVFTTSTDFEDQRSYDRFGAYVALNHDGDFSAGYHALARQGYGHRFRAKVSTVELLGDEL